MNRKNFDGKQKKKKTENQTLTKFYNRKKYTKSNVNNHKNKNQNVVKQYKKEKKLLTDR